MPYNKDTFLKDVLFYTKEKGTFSEMCQRIEGKVYSATNNWEVRNEALEDVYLLRSQRRAGSCQARLESCNY